MATLGSGGAGSGIKSIQRGEMGAQSYNLPISNVVPEKCTCRFWVNKLGLPMVNSEVSLHYTVYGSSLAVIGKDELTLGDSEINVTGYRWELTEYA